MEPIDIAVNPSYMGRVKYFWDATIKNSCTLQLFDIKMTDSAEYRARIVTKTDKWQSCSAIQLTVTGDSVLI